MSMYTGIVAINKTLQSGRFLRYYSTQGVKRANAFCTIIICTGSYHKNNNVSPLLTFSLTYRSVQVPYVGEQLQYSSWFNDAVIDLLPSHPALAAHTHAHIIQHHTGKAEFKKQEQRKTPVTATFLLFCLERSQLTSCNHSVEKNCVCV